MKHTLFVHQPEEGAPSTTALAIPAQSSAYPWITRHIRDRAWLDDMRWSVHDVHVLSTEHTFARAARRAIVKFNACVAAVRTDIAGRVIERTGRLSIVILRWIGRVSACRIRSLLVVTRTDRRTRTDAGVIRRRTFIEVIVFIERTSRCFIRLRVLWNARNRSPFGSHNC